MDLNLEMLRPQKCTWRPFANKNRHNKNIDSGFPRSASARQSDFAPMLGERVRLDKGPLDVDAGFMACAHFGVWVRVLR
jgi:hypothetical protein